MPPPRQFRDADVLIVEPQGVIRDAIRNVLHTGGFRRIDFGSSLESIQTRVAEAPPDLLICESELQDGGFPALLSAMRHHEIGRNPFLNVMALMSEPTPAKVKAVIDAGVDLLVAKPVTANVVLSRLQLLVDARKPFVVTSDYIGPDRRRDTDRPSEVPLIDVPNTLRAKANGQGSADDLAKAIAQATAEINLRKLERYAFHAGYLSGRIVPALAFGGPDPATSEDLDRLLYVAEDMSRRLGGTRYDHVSELCLSLSKVTRAVIDAGDDPSSKNVKLLAQLAKSIQKGFDTSTASAAREISASVGR